jgi:hypothetical protein
VTDPLPPITLAPFQEATIQAYAQALRDAARAIAELEPMWARVAADMRRDMGYVQQPDHAHRLHVAYDRRRRARRRRNR